MEQALGIGRVSEHTRDGHEKLQQSKKVVIFIGPEGSGKTSQARMFANEIGLPYLIYGDVFREAAKNDRTILGDECRRVFREHNYIKLEVLKELVSRELGKEIYQSGVVIDGALRIPGEVESFEALLNSAGIENPNITIFYLRIPGWKGFERTLTERKRLDDTEKGMMGRLGAFYSGLGQRMSQIRKKTEDGSWKFKRIITLGSIDETGKEILKKFNDS